MVASCRGCGKYCGDKPVARCPNCPANPVAPTAAQHLSPTSLSFSASTATDIDSQYNSFRTAQIPEPWRTPGDLNIEVARLAQEMAGDPFLDEEPRDNGAYREKFYRALASRVLPDMKGAPVEEVMDLARQVDRAGNTVHHMFLARSVWNEVAYLKNNLNYGDEESDLAEANRRVAEELREQGAPYDPASLLELRLDGVQMGLADPTHRSVTVKPPSGYEIEVSKPDARALLRSIGIEPEKTRQYEPIWP